MSKQMSREERLAAQLRANLKRRKVQARALDRIGPQAREGERPPAAGAACCASSEDASAEALAQEPADSPDLPKPDCEG